MVNQSAQNSTQNSSKTSAKTSTKTSTGTSGEFSDDFPDEASYDIIIAGGGYVGLSTAVSIKSGAPHLKIALIDAAPKAAVEKDTRASAIAAAASRMLDQLGLWQELVKDAQAINEMIVTDSKLSDVVRPVFLTFALDKKEENDAPFAHMLPNKSLVKMLRAKAQSQKVDLIYEDAVTDFSTHDHFTKVTLRSNKTFNAKLLIACDGVRSTMREKAGIKTVHWPYDQMGIVITVAHERPHEGKAVEHFLPAGPFAILPLSGNRSSLVWTEKTEDAKRLLALDDFEFEFELEQRFGHQLGEIEVEGARKAFPLGLTLARDYVKQRFALAGDAAHGIHPIAGQGLNLGFKDAAALAETIIETDRLGLDIGSLTALERYQEWRRFDTVQMGITTDVLNRLFSNDNTPLRLIRDFGLGLVERMPAIKQSFISTAAGNDKGTPKLLRGEEI